MTSSQLINQDSGDCEYFTPQDIIEAAREVMGSIDLDPASSQLANMRVKATQFFDKAFDSLRPDAIWSGRVWMNHPFSRAENRLWIDKLASEYSRGGVYQACCITFAATSEAWFQPLLKRPQCFLSPRTNYVLPDGTLKRGVTKGSVVTYFGHNGHKFARIFRQFGIVKACI